MNKKTIKDVELKGKKVLVRVDFNVPQDEKGTITDDTRIRETLPTINFLLNKGAKVILCSHLGRPDGKVVEKYRLAPVGQRLSQLLGKPVKVLKDCVGPEVEKTVGQMKEGEVILLENLRFYIEEEKNDPEFARKLARLADIFVMDAFGVSHRAHASTEGITKFIPSVAGFLLEKELQYLGKALDNPERPFAIILGGAKISDKIGVLQHILNRVNFLFIGGGMACTFLKSRGLDMGNSLVETERLETAREIEDKAKKSGVTIYLPVDFVAAPSIDKGALAKVVGINAVPSTWLVGDVGPQTLVEWSKALKECRTIIWNGPLGIFEKTAFARGTTDLVKILSGLKAATIIGGGSTAEAVESSGLADKMTFVSTGGGASLQMLEGKPLPGVSGLLDKDN